MMRLSIDSLPVNNRNLELPKYDRADCQTGIVHIGVGNFHRTHQAVYCDDLLNKGEYKWGITGVSLRSPTIRNALAPQDFLYTVVTFGTETTYRIIGSILNILVAPENPAAVVGVIADKQTQVVTITITEKGYCLSMGKVDTNHHDIAQDIMSLKSPKTVYGYLAAGIIKRFKDHRTPLTVICCDNLQDGNKYLESGVEMLLSKHSPESYEWTLQHTRFPISMVDRISPATDCKLKQLVTSQIGIRDEWPVSTELFSQWVIEDNFAGKRPAFDEVGAELSSDVSQYVQMKLRILNCGHSMISVFGYLFDETTIHESLKNELIFRFVNEALIENVLPVTAIPSTYDGKEYIRNIFQRFTSSAIPYAVLQVGTDSSKKIQQRWLPIVDNALEQQSNMQYLLFSLAAWVCFIEKALDCNQLIDPHRDNFHNSRNNNQSNVHAFLSIANANEYVFFKHEPTIAAIQYYYQKITELGVEIALPSFLDEEYT